MITLWVDGDACPVKNEIARVALRYQCPVVIVSNQGLRAAYEGNVKGVMVGPEFDAADNWIVEHISGKDIVITADIQLAARCLKKAAFAVAPTGKLFTLENIGSALAMRELSAHLRETGDIAGHNPSFSKQDRSQFLQSLDTLIQKARRLP